MVQEDGQPDGQTLDLNDPGKSAPGAQDGGKPRWKLKVKGQEFVVDDEAKAIELMQKGVHYDQRLAAVKERERQLTEKEAKDLAALEPWFELDRRAREDPSLQRRLQAVIHNQPLPDEDADTDDPYDKRINALNRKVDVLIRTVEGRVGGVDQGLQRLNRNERFRSEERTLRQRYKNWATDEAIDDARAFAEQHGLDLVTAFKSLNFDELPERIRQDVIEEFQIDPASISPERGEIPSIDGLGPLTPETRARVYADPDLYARFRPQFIEERRRRTGKAPLPR